MRIQHSVPGQWAMTGFAITEGRAMTSTASRAGSHRSAWGEVVVAWAMAAALAGVLLLMVSDHDKESSATSSWPLTPSAHYAHQMAVDPEGPASDETCSDRDYANERC